jgi:hypothetical protein
MLEVNENRLRYMDKKGWHEFRSTDVEQRPYGHAHVDQAYGIVEWIEGKNDNYLGQANHGKAALEIMLAVYESARMHERVQLPLLTRANPLDVAVESGVLPVERPGMYDERSFLVRGEAMSWSPPKR